MFYRLRRVIRSPDLNDLNRCNRAIRNMDKSRTDHHHVAIEPYPFLLPDIDNDRNRFQILSHVIWYQAWMSCTS
jgi:hypothetical protein